MPLTARQGDLRTLLVFTDARAAHAHLHRVGAQPGSDWEVAAYAAGDWRGKEELLRAAATAGATRVDVDPDLALRPRGTLDLTRAARYVASYKRATACL